MIQKYCTIAFLFLLFSLALFAHPPQKTYAQLCWSSSDCACNQQCFAFMCQNAAFGGDLTCQGTLQCTAGYYFDTNHNMQIVNNYCGYISTPANICPGSSVAQPSPLGGYCSTNCGASCNQGATNTCGSGYYCSSDNSCTCVQSCSSIPGAICRIDTRPCPAGYQPSATAYCGDGSNYICCEKIPTCNTGVSCSGWSACGGYPANTCYSGNGSQSQTCTYTTYNNGTATCIQPTAWTNWQSCTVNNCYAGYTCSGGNCVTHIYANVYTDYNHDGAKNGNDAGKAGVPVSDGYTTVNTDANGNVTFSGLRTGTYTISETVPANFQAVNSASQGITLTNGTPNQTVNFFVTPLYSISGRTFNDLNKNQKFDSTDTGIGGVTIHVSGGPTAVADMTTAADGTWSTPTNLLSGTYTVAYASTLAAGYRFTTPSSFSVTVGNPNGSPACNIGGSLDASCGGVNNGSIANLDFGESNETVWNQSACFDVRNDSGTYTNLIPASPSCGGVTGAYNAVTNANCSTGAGIMFSCNATPNFGLGSANANNWEAGGTQQECFTGAGLNVIRTSYNYLLTTARQSNITPIDMTTVCGAGGLANCTLPPTLAKGVYQANGSVTLNAYTFPVDPSNPQGFIFLISGDLHILGNILVPAGSVAAFSTSGNIYVDQGVGNVITSVSDANNNNPNIEGLYSADGNFVVQSYTSGTTLCNADGTPLDKKLNIVGSVVTNAGQAGGAFLNNRDLCLYDTSCPAVSIGDGFASNTGLATSYLLTLYADGKFLNHRLYNWQELRP